jgi:hypothetical protein
VNVNEPSLSGGTIIGDNRCGAPIASTFHGASIARTLWLKRRLRTGWLIFPLSIHHRPSRVRPVTTIVRGSTRRTYQNREISRPRGVALIMSSSDVAGPVLSRM